MMPVRDVPGSGEESQRFRQAAREKRVVDVPGCEECHVQAGLW